MEVTLVSVPWPAGKEAVTLTLLVAPSVTVVRSTLKLMTLTVSSSVMVNSAGTTNNSPEGTEAVPEGLTTRNVSPSSRTASETGVTAKDPTASDDPAGMVMVKSGTAPKSASWAVPAATDTGTITSAAGAAGRPALPKPTREAITSTSVSLPSVTEEGLTDKSRWASPSRMVISDPITNAPSALPVTARVSGPSKSASSAAVIVSGAEERRWPAPMVTSKSATAVKSAICAEPAANDTVATVSCAGRGGSPAPPYPTHSAVSVASVVAPSGTPAGLTRKTIPRPHPATPAQGT